MKIYISFDLLPDDPEISNVFLEGVVLKLSKVSCLDGKKVFVSLHFIVRKNGNLNH